MSQQLAQLSATDGVHEAIYQRRSSRSFTDEKPSALQIQGLIDAAVQAPSAMHREPWAFAVVQDKAVLKRYSDRAKSMLLSQDMAVGWGSVGRSDEDHPAMPSDPEFNIFYDAGTLVVICRTQDSPFAEADCWLAAENLMLAAQAQGLGSCCIGFAVPVLNQPDIKRQLGIPPVGAAVAPIILGFARGRPGKTSRRKTEILRWLR